MVPAEGCADVAGWLFKSSEERNVYAELWRKSLRDNMDMLL